MASADEILLGKIALQFNLVTGEDLAACVQEQERSAPPKPLGMILVAKGLVTPAQLQRCLDQQKKNLSQVDPVTQKRKDSILFGKIAVHEGFSTVEEVNECLRTQASSADKGEEKFLGEIMVDQGFLTDRQVKRILGMQQKKLLACPKCNLTYNVVTLSDRKVIKCPKCATNLVEPRKSASVRADEVFETQTFLKAVNAKTIASSAAKPRKIAATCPVCDTAFEGTSDAEGRVRCPSCTTEFTPR